MDLVQKCRSTSLESFYLPPEMEGEHSAEELPGNGSDSLIPTPPTGSLAVTFRNLNYSVPSGPKGKDRLHILKNVSGCFRPGRLTALLGPSGSGKTTLMDLLAGRKSLKGGTDLNGVIKYGGERLDWGKSSNSNNGEDQQILSIQSLRFLTGYVEQFDTLVGELTVRNMLLYTAELKLAASLSPERIEKRVDAVIKKLSLESCKNTTIGGVLTRGISGGEAKRVNIALALITKPKVLFLDEPTSGLDSYTANEVVLLLKALSLDGCTVVCTIHTPTALAFSLFDDLLMLRKGQLIYGGELSKAKFYFLGIGHNLETGHNSTNGGEHTNGVTKGIEGTSGTHRSVSEGSHNKAMHLSEGTHKNADENEKLHRTTTEDTNKSAASYFNATALDKGIFSLPEWLTDVASGRPTQTNLSNDGFKLSQRGQSKESGGSKDDGKEDDLGKAAKIDLISEFQNSAAFGELDRMIGNFESSSVAKQDTNLMASITPASSTQEILATMKRVPHMSALKTLLKYRMSAHYRDGEFLGPRIGDKVLYGLIIMTLYWDVGSKPDAESIQSIAGLLFFVAALCGFGAAAFVPSLTLDRPLFYRELADGCYHPLVYYAAKFCEEAILCTITSFLFGMCVFWTVGLEGSFAIFAITYFLTSMVGIVLAYAVAAVCPTVDAANALLPTYVTFCLYFGGLFIQFDMIPIGWEWFSWTSFLRYSWGVWMLNHFGEGKQGALKVFPAGDGVVNANGMPVLVNVLEFYDLQGDIMGNIEPCLCLLSMLLIIFTILGAWILVAVKHGNR